MARRKKPPDPNNMERRFYTSSSLVCLGGGAGRSTNCSPPSSSALLPPEAGGTGAATIGTACIARLRWPGGDLPSRRDAWQQRPTSEVRLGGAWPPLVVKHEAAMAVRRKAGPVLGHHGVCFDLGRSSDEASRLPRAHSLPARVVKKGTHDDGADDSEVEEGIEAVR